MVNTIWRVGEPMMLAEINGKEVSIRGNHCVFVIAIDRHVCILKVFSIILCSSITVGEVADYT